MITGQRPQPPSMGSRRPPAGRPPGRRGGGGIGPGPGYRPSRTGGGTTHGSSTGTRSMAIGAAVLFGVPVLVMLAIVVFLVWPRG